MCGYTIRGVKNKRVRVGVCGCVVVGCVVIREGGCVVIRERGGWL